MSLGMPHEGLCGDPHNGTPPKSGPAVFRLKIKMKVYTTPWMWVHIVPSTHDSLKKAIVRTLPRTSRGGECGDTRLNINFSTSEPVSPTPQKIWRKCVTTISSFVTTKCAH